jgi:hypothetical protein
MAEGFASDIWVIEFARDVQTAEAPDRRVERRLDVVAAGDVAGHGERSAAGLLDHPGGFAVAVGGDVGDDDARPLSGEGERRRAADAAGRSGDERDLADEARILTRGDHRLPLCVVALAHGCRSTLIASRWSIAW